MYEADPSTHQAIQVLMLHVHDLPWLGSADVEAADEAADPRAELVLQLLLASLEQPAPNLSHLLCGFDFESGELIAVSAIQLYRYYHYWPIWPCSAPLWMGAESVSCLPLLDRQVLASHGRVNSMLGAHCGYAWLAMCKATYHAGMGPVYLPDPRGQYNVLRVVLNALLVRRFGTQVGVV